MIKIEKKHDCESFFNKDALFDSKREKEYKLSIFGLVIYKNISHYSTDVKNEKSNGVGFKKE